MANRREELHSIFVNIMNKLEYSAKNVYFQPPENLKISYPAIIYHSSKRDTDFADDSPYKIETRYTVTVIDRDPESLIVPELLKLPMCVHDRSAITDNLNHDYFTLYY